MRVDNVKVAEFLMEEDSAVIFKKES